MNTIVKKTGIYAVIVCALACPRVTVSMSSSSSHMPRRIGIGTTLLALAWTWYDTRQREAARPLWYWGSRSPHITPLEDAYNVVSDHTGTRTSQSRNHIDILAQARAPELITEQQERAIINTQDAYEARIRVLLRHYYRDAWMELPQLMQRRLQQAVVVFTAREEETADTHYSLYHGTYDVAGMLLRTMLYGQGQFPNSTLLFRNPGDTDLLRSVADINKFRQEYNRKLNEAQGRARERMRNAPPPILGGNGGHTPDLVLPPRPDDYAGFAQYFLSVNPAIMGNSWPIRPKGTNTLRFLTPLLGTNSWFNMLEYRVRALMQIMFTSPSSVDSLRAIFNHTGRPELYERYRNELIPLTQGLSMIIQIQIPRTGVVRMYNAEPGGTADSGESRDILARLQTTNPLTSTPEIVSQNMLVLRSRLSPTDDQAEQVDIRQMRIALDPDIWENPARHDIRMNVIIRGDEQQLKQLFAKLHAIAQELKQKS
jgi:hypothetical protein